MTRYAPLPVLLISPRLGSWRAFGLGAVSWFLGSLHMWHYLLKAIELPLPLVLILGGPGMFFRSRRAVISKVHSGRWNMEGDAFIPDVLGYVRILEQRRGVWFAWQNIAGLVLFSRARKRLRLTCGLASPQTA